MFTNDYKESIADTVRQLDGAVKALVERTNNISKQMDQL